MKPKIIFIFMVMLLAVTISKKSYAQGFGLEQNDDGSYTLFMNGGSITTNNTGNYISGSTGILTVCNGCTVTSIQTPTTPAVQDLSNWGYVGGTVNVMPNTYLASNPPPNSYSYIPLAGGNGLAWYDANGVYLGIVGYTSSPPTTTTYELQACPSCEAAAAQQAAEAQMTAAYETALQAQTTAQYTAAITFLQTQLNNTWQQQNAALFYYYYYYNYDAQQVRSGYSGSVASLTPPSPPMMAVRTDTMSPTIVTDTAARQLGATLTALLRSVDSTTEMKDLRANAPTRKFEVGFSIQWSKKYAVVYNVANYNKSGTTQNVTISNTDFNTIALVHTHPPTDSSGKMHRVDGPSATDMVGLISALTDTIRNSGNPNKIIANFVISGDSLHHNEYVVTIVDTAAIKAFLAKYPVMDSVIDTRKTIQVNGKDTANSQLNNWKGDKNDPNSLYGQYWKKYHDFQSKGYPAEYLEDYANVYMMWRLNMGVKFYLKVNGIFKELNYDPITDKVTISQ